MRAPLLFSLLLRASVVSSISLPLACSAQAAQHSSARSKSNPIWKEGKGKSVAKRSQSRSRSRSRAHSQSLAPVLREIQPTVVSIRTRHSSSRSHGFSRVRGQQPEGLGSGFIISEQGLIVTNNHVVARGDQFEVHLADHRVFSAKLLGSDPSTDIALLKIEGAKDLPTAVFGASERTHVGDWVLAVGSPIGLEQSVTRGIVSAKGRGDLGLYRGGYVDFLQTDAAINPGNSGGPLFNLNGEVIGMNTAVSGIGSGLGFAVPIDQIKEVLPSLYKHGHFERGWLGVSGLGQVVPAHGNSIPAPGAEIQDVQPGSPAQQAGLRSGDIVLSVDGHEVSDFADFRGQLGHQQPHQTVTLIIDRNQTLKTFKVELGTRPSPHSQARRAEHHHKKHRPQDSLYSSSKPKLGVTVERSPRGIIIREVQPGGIAHQLGLREHDRLQTINGQTIRDVPDIPHALRMEREQVSVSVSRGDSTHSATLQQR